LCFVYSNQPEQIRPARGICVGGQTPRCPDGIDPGTLQLNPDIFYGFATSNPVKNIARPSLYFGGSHRLALVLASFGREL
jgi:hypothetical protein